MLNTEKNCLNGQTMPKSNRATCESGIQQFSFDGTYDVQVVMRNGEPYFIAVDICNLLGLSNPTKAIYGIDNDEHTTLPIVRSGQQRIVNVVNESGLYALIFQSRKPAAKKFRKWVTSEVLPTIRNTGMYVTEKKTDSTQEVSEWKQLYRRLEMIMEMNRQITELVRSERDYLRGECDYWQSKAIERNKALLQLTSL